MIPDRLLDILDRAVTTWELSVKTRTAEAQATSAMLKALSDNLQSYLQDITTPKKTPL